MKTKKYLFLALCIFILGTFISACGGGGKSTPPSYPFIPVSTPTPTVSPTPEPTVSPTPIPTVSPTPIPTVSPTPTPTVSPTPTPTVSPTPAKYPLELSETEFTVNVGETTNITVSLNGEDITQTANYEVDQEAIATVEGGLITGVSVGVATVTVNAENAESEKTFTVNVIDPTLPSLEVNPTEVTLNVNEEATVAVTLEGKVVTEDVTYTSDNESIATADKGTVRGLKLGIANITVSLEGANSAVFKVNVNPFAKAQKGDEVEFGRYPQTKVEGSDPVEWQIQPIKWRVLARDDDKSNYWQFLLMVLTQFVLLFKIQMVI